MGCSTERFVRVAGVATQAGVFLLAACLEACPTRCRESWPPTGLPQNFLFSAGAPCLVAEDDAFHIGVDTEAATQSLALVAATGGTGN
ncbi:transposase IS116/IS110/IS902 family protein [Mycobacterium sp. PO1]|nr:transposase IS116/IS110/IS902 family protein [Mycobacterium sp. PO1]GFM25089.1 transposase IS116/IS110/IS902 family protein [Mycobacterium sp. PO2]